MIKCTVLDVWSMATAHPFEDLELITGSGLPTPVVRPVIQNSTVHGPLPGCRVGELGIVTTPLVALNESAGLGASSRSPPPTEPADTPVSVPAAKSACVVSKYEVAFIVAVRSSSCELDGVETVDNVSRTLRLAGAVLPVFAPTAWTSPWPRLRSLDGVEVRVGPPNRR